MFAAAIVAAGPAGEPDFADHRYWVRRTDGAVLIATNTSEVGRRTHAVLPGTAVLVHESPTLGPLFLCRPTSPTR